MTSQLATDFALFRAGKFGAQSSFDAHGCFVPVADAYEFVCMFLDDTEDPVAEMLPRDSVPLPFRLGYRAEARAIRA